MTEISTASTTYRVTLDRPSRSKCPNAWAKLAGQDGWLGDTFEVEAGAEIKIGGTVRRASRQERTARTIVIDETGEWDAWGGTGTVTVEVA